MLAGFDRYMQIASGALGMRFARDQNFKIDLEMSFIDREDVMW